MTQDKILDKLGKIKAHMESAQEIGNEAEAQAFAAMLQTLLAKHKLEMTDIQYSQHLAEEPVAEYGVGSDNSSQQYEYRDGKRFYKKYPDVEVVYRRIEWIENLAGIVARAHSCEILVCQGRSSVWFVGRKSDVQIAEYLFITMQRTAEKLSHKEYKKFRAQCRKEDNGGGAYLHRTHGFKASFLEAFTMRLFERFEEEKHKMEHDYSGTALMRINREALAVRSYLDEKKGKKAKSLNSNQGFNEEGYRRGKATADSMRLDANAVKEGQANKQIGGGR